MKRVLLITGGSVSLGLGVIGIFLPILPTTPFLILSATCYLKSSERLYHWLLNHRLLGRYVRSYMLYRALTIKAKAVSIVTLWVVILSSFIFFVEVLWVKLLLIVIAIGVTIYLVSIRTLTKEMIKEA